MQRFYVVQTVSLREFSELNNQIHELTPNVKALRLGVQTGSGTTEFSLNVSLNSANSVTKIFVIPVKGPKHSTSCARDQDATTAPV